ncbi:uncharacterized protein MELLADRAFT_66991 [Melampsora larici-populina 98AG31]|uniref:Uncharacterized protein n=1 Tax=Melampsora larici-populina (strain 98AG31 / pathotype 3-4-7) TaxID=747676 RepID=F4S1E2_MELLP|nr:uncharacterized protein MELLADRAFT_66991 [Melampsora larici-populina 98AG31]EGG01575.1 hypothetical protein MELLADRAFT_66991 [Melampsora larici-populina 98AG31]
MAHADPRLTVTLDGTFTLGDMVEETPPRRHYYARHFWMHLVNSPSSSSKTPLIFCKPFGQYILDVDLNFALRGNLIPLPYPCEPVLDVNPTQYVETSTTAEMNTSQINSMSVLSLGRVTSCNLSNNKSHWDALMEHRDYEPNVSRELPLSRSSSDVFYRNAGATASLSNTYSPEGTFKKARFSPYWDLSLHTDLAPRHGQFVLFTS